MHAPVFHATGKQVKRRGAHFADAHDERAAAQIVSAMNLILETPACEPLTACGEPIPTPHEGD